MTVINPNSISGVASVTAQGDIIQFYKSDGTLGAVQFDGANFNTTSGVSTFKNLYVGGTLTYEDVKNVDSVGIITARAGIFVDDSITHIGDTNTKIRFPADDTVTVETNGSERLRIDSTGRVLIGSTSADDTSQKLKLHQAGNDHCLLNLNVSSSSYSSLINFGDSGSWSIGQIAYAHSDDSLRFKVNGGERLRIASNGRVGINSTVPTAPLNIQAEGSTGHCVRLNQETTNKKASIYFQDATTTGNDSWITNENYDLTVYAGYGGKLKLGAYQTTGITVLSTGKIGIGSDIPSQKLDVMDGTIHVHTSSRSGVALNGINNQDVGVVRWGGDNHHAILLRGSSSADGTTITGGDTMEFREYGAYSFKTGNNSGTMAERLRITSGGDIQVDNGNVHIDDNGEFAIFEQDTARAMTNSSKISMDFSGNVARIRSSHNGSGSNAVSRNLGFYIGSGQKLLITSTEITAAVQLNIESAGSYIKSNQLKFNPNGDAFIDHGVTSKDITFRLSNSSALDFNAIKIDSSAQQTKFGKQIVVGLQGGNDVTTIGGGSGIGAYIQLEHASSGINTKLMGNNDSYLNQFHGNLAIGEDDPDGNKLLIRAASTVGTNKGHIMLSGDSATVGQGPQIVFSESGSGSSYAGGYVGFLRQGSNSIGDLVFGTRNTSGDASTAPVERMRITSGGDVGIGQDNPTERFHIKQDDAVGPSITLEHNSSSHKCWINNWGSSGGGSGRQNKFEINATTVSSLALASVYISLQAGGAGDSFERVRITTTALLPGTDNNLNLGSSSKRWANIYTGDLQLSNVTGIINSNGEPITPVGNEVDDTQGTWTIQEGLNDLFLINRINGKKYKFNLTEVS